MQLIKGLELEWLGDDYQGVDEWKITDRKVSWAFQVSFHPSTLSTQQWQFPPNTIWRANLQTSRRFWCSISTQTMKKNCDPSSTNHQAALLPIILASSSWRTLSRWEGTRGCWTNPALGSWWCQGCWLELLGVVRDNTTPQPAARSLFASRTATFYLLKLDMQKWFPAYRCAMVCLLKAAASANFYSPAWAILLSISTPIIRKSPHVNWNTRHVCLLHGQPELLREIQASSPQCWC